VLHRILFKLFHIEESIDRNVVEIKNKSKDIDGLQAEQERHDEALERVRASQARSRNSVMQMEKKIKKADKSLEAKVCFIDYTTRACNLYVVQASRFGSS